MNFSLNQIIIVIFLIVQLICAPLSDSCPDPIYRTAASVTDLITKLKAANFKDKMLEVLKAEVPKDTRMFTGAQIVDIFNTVTYADSKKQALQIIAPYVQFLKTQEIIDLLKNLTFSNYKIECLEVLAQFLDDASAANKQKIIDQSFNTSFEKMDASDIFSRYASRNCIYGAVTEISAIFLIDVSPSMQYTFKNKAGATVKRIDFVKEQLTATITEQLKDFQSFNIIIFGDSTKQWQTDLVKASQDNIKSAIGYLNTLPEIGGTNISGAVEAAYASAANVEAIYFLSDGSPTGGLKDVTDLKNKLNALNKDKTDKKLNAIKIHVTSFMLGGSEKDDEKKSAKAFMQTLADTTQGSFRDMSGVA